MTFKTGGATMMFCPDMPFEDAYLKALNKVEQYMVTDQELQLKGKDQLLIVYVPVDTTQRVGVAEDDHGCNAAAGYHLVGSKTELYPFVRRRRAVGV